MIKCPKCQSLKIMRIRLDSDWVYGIGDYEIVNEDKYYSEEELKYDTYDRPDIVVKHCLCCNSFFD